MRAGLGQQVTLQRFMLGFRLSALSFQCCGPGLGPGQLRADVFFLSALFFELEGDRCLGGVDRRLPPSAA